MAEFTAVPGLDALVARMIVPEVNRIAHEVVAESARGLAPPSKRWVNAGDDRVREPHVHAEGQEVADNVRFELTAYEWDLEHPGASAGVSVTQGDGSGWSGPSGKTVPGSTSYLLMPRDPTGGHYVQIVNCRCAVVKDPQGVAKTVGVDDAIAKGTKVRAVVYAEGDIAVKAEHGDLYPFPVSVPVAKGTLFMHRAAVMAANVLRARQ